MTKKINAFIIHVIANEHILCGIILFHKLCILRLACCRNAISVNERKNKYSSSMIDSTLRARNADKFV